MKLDGGRYEVMEELGRGTFARVYRGQDHKHGRPCAIKVLNARAGRETRKRFVAEVRALARLRHPHILAVYGAGTHGDQGYVVTELAAGGSLLDLVRREGTLPVDDTLVWMIQTLSALAAAHASAVVHRDVKPSNILLDDTGSVRLGDFGIAMQVAEDIQRLTRTGTALGTTIYMAPEQRRDAKHVGPRADLYAIGSSIYRLVTGLNPQDLFAATDGSERWQRIPAKLRPMLRRACQLEPEERYGDAAEMAEALIELLGDEARARVQGIGSCDPAGFPAPSPRFELERLEPKPVAEATPHPPKDWPGNAPSTPTRPSPDDAHFGAAPDTDPPQEPPADAFSAVDEAPGSAPSEPSQPELPSLSPPRSLPPSDPPSAASAAPAPITSPEPVNAGRGNKLLVAAVAILLVISVVELVLLASR